MPGAGGSVESGPAVGLRRAVGLARAFVSALAIIVVIGFATGHVKQAAWLVAGKVLVCPLAGDGTEHHRPELDT